MTSRSKDEGYTPGAMVSLVVMIAIAVVGWAVGLGLLAAGHTEAALEQLGAEAAALGVYQLPAEPPATVHSLWDAHGCRWTRHVAVGHWELAEAAPGPDGRHWHVPVDGCVTSWRTLVAECGPLSTTPPAGTEGQRHADQA